MTLDDLIAKNSPVLFDLSVNDSLKMCNEVLDFNFEQSQRQGFYGLIELTRLSVSILHFLENEQFVKVEGLNDVDFNLMHSAIKITQSRLLNDGSDNGSAYITLYGGKNAHNIGEFWRASNKQKKEHINLLQIGRPTYIGTEKGRNNFSSTFNLAFYPKADEIALLKQMFSLNAVTRESLKTLDNDCCVMIVGAVVTNTNSNEMLSVKNLSKERHVFNPFAIVLVPSNKHIYFNNISVFATMPQLMFEKYKTDENSNYLGFKENLSEKLRKEYDEKRLQENNISLDAVIDKQIYLAWELEVYQTQSQDLLSLKDNYDFPISDDLIFAMENLENSFKN